MSDIDLLHFMQAERNDHHWLIGFEIRFPGMEPEDDWAYDEFVVASGRNSELAIQKLKEFISVEENYGQRVTDVRILNVKLLSEAEII